MKTASFDFGKYLGYAFWDNDKLICSGILTLNWSDPNGYDKFVQQFRELIIQHNPAKVWTEKEYRFFPDGRSKINLSKYHDAFSAARATLSLLGIATKFIDTRRMAKKKQAQSIVSMMLNEKPIQFKRNGKTIIKYPRSTHECEAILLGMLVQNIQTLEGYK